MNEGALREILRELGIEVLAKNGSGWLVAHCPFAPLGFHEKGIDRDPSFFVRPNPKGVSGFNCFTCKVKGRVSALVAKLEHYGDQSFGNLSTRVNLIELRNDFGTFGEFDDDDGAPQPIEEGIYEGVYPLAWENQRAREYLVERGVTRNAAAHMGLLYDEDGLRILFPVRSYRGALWGFSGRSVIPDGERRNAKVKDYAGLKKRWVLLGEEGVQQSDWHREAAGLPRLPLLVVEGLFAYAHMVSIGARELCNPVATLGSVTSVMQRDRIASLDRPTYYLYDDDLAGDIGLFGPQDKKTGEHRGGGAVDLLCQHVPLYVAYYPERFALGEGDPDLFTIDDVGWVFEAGHKLY